MSILKFFLLFVLYGTSFCNFTYFCTTKVLNLPNVTMKFDFQETQRLMQEPVPGISAVPDDQNARYFHVVVAGKLHLSFEVFAT